MAAADVKAILDRRRTCSDAPKDTDLFPVFNFLFAEDDQIRHWYCPKSPSALHTEAATFLLFLFAFKQEGNAKAFADSLRQLQSSCEKCACGFALARKRFGEKYVGRLDAAETSYFARFTHAAQTNFFAVIDRWQTGLILGAVRTAAGSSSSPSSTFQLHALPRPILYSLLFQPSLLANADIASLVDIDVESTPSFIPTQGLTPVLVHFLASSDARRSSWANAQLKAVKSRPVTLFEWDAGVGIEVQRLYVDAGQWEAVTAIAESGGLRDDALQHGLIEGTIASQPTHRGAGEIIFSRLGSDDDAFPAMLRALSSLLHLAPTRHFWVHDTSSELPHTIFTSIKNNPAYLRMSQDMPRYWMSEFLLSIKDMGKSEALQEVIADVGSFTLVEMQHERFDPGTRLELADAGCSLLPSSTSTAELHAPFIATLAFGIPRRDVAVKLYDAVLEADVSELQSCITNTASIAHAERKRLLAVKRGKQAATAQPVQHLPRPDTHTGLWASAYDRIRPSDAVGAALVMRRVCQIAHFEPLRKSLGWGSAELGEIVDKDRWTLHITAINAAIDTMLHPLHGIVEALQIDACVSFWTQPAAAQTAVWLLLSPRESIHDPVIGLIQQSFDNVDDRGDCFRVLLETHPGSAMDGLEQALLFFLRAAHILPEACSLAKWLVRCATDVLETLCRPSGFNAPLLQSDAFLNHDATGTRMSRRVSKLWTLMTATLALILKRTLDWAPFYENEVMTDWMRDALLFGRAMTDNIRVFEGAVLGRTSARQSEPVTQTGKDLVNGLGSVLRNLVLWLRLTDAETLHQTYELIKAIITLTAKTRRNADDLDSLEPTLLEIDKFCRRISKSYNCRLSDDRLSELADLLAQFELPVNEELPPVSMATDQAVPAPKRDAFAMLMGGKGKVRTAALARSVVTPKSVTTLKPTPPAASSSVASRSTPGSSKAPITVEDFDDDPLLLSLSSADLDVIERRAQSSVAAQPSKKAVVSKPTVAGHPAKPAPGHKFASKFMREQAAMHKAGVSERKRFDVSRPDVPRPPPPSKIGSGLGAYQGKRQAAALVDSGSSASESSDEDTTLGAHKPKSPAKRFSIPSMASRSTKILGPSYANIMRERNAQQAAARATKLRLHPDLWPLYRIILTWDPDARGPLSLKEVARRIPTSLHDSEQYDQIMLPLFLRELWAQFLKEDPRDPPVVAEIASRTYEDDFIDLEVVINVMPHSVRLYDTDIVTLKQGGGAKPVYAKVQSVRRKPKDSAVKLRLLSQMDQRELGTRTKWRLQKHISLSTSLREFGALRGLPYYEPQLLADILAARSAALPRHSLEDVEAAMRIYNVNEPQAGAILGALQVQGFALIQGPPGTGKTKTICGLVGKFMAERKVGVSVAGDKATKPKLLICAPSNAAIDEVCKRLLDGVPGPHGQQVPAVVRIGVEAAVNIAVKNVSLDNLIEVRVNADPASAGDGEYAKLQQELDTIKKSIVAKQSEISAAADGRKREVEVDLHELQNRRNMLGQRASKAKDAVRDATRHLEGARRAARDAVLGDADIICATLSGAGHESLASYVFETVIVDEAAQAIELSCLIPLKYGCRRCIMIGDPKQLPPTTFDPNAERLAYNQSLFVRIAQQRESRMHLLSIQYRMHPFISELPSKVFYDGKLQDGPGMAAKTAAIWHHRQVLGPYRFFHVEGREQRAGTSTKNPVEAAIAAQLFRCLDDGFGQQLNMALRVGVITMYREQLLELKRKFSETFGAAILEQIEFNTVDGFQGQEKDIIILSCVRSGPNLSSIGFLKDFRRMNVALTRAKSSLFVIGDAHTLERSDERWKIIVGDARDRGFLIKYSDATFTQAARVPTPTSPKAKTRKRLSVQPTPVKKLKPSTVTAPDSPRRATSATPPVVAKNEDKTDHVTAKVLPTTIAKPVPAPAAATVTKLAANSARSHALPPKPASRTAEDVLFIKKKVGRSAETRADQAEKEQHGERANRQSQRPSDYQQSHGL